MPRRSCGRDCEVVLVAVQRDGGTLKHASPELRADREVVLAAVRKNVRALKWASLELRADRELMNVSSDLSEHCGVWAAAGECEKNPAYMLSECARSCGL